MARTALIAMSALAGTIEPGRFGAPGDGPPGVRLAERTGVLIRHIASRKGKVPDVLARMSSLTGASLVDGPRVVMGGGLELVGSAPGQWLALAAGEGTDEVLAKLTDAVADVASLTDHSAAKMIVRIEGPSARNVLAKGCPIDLHPVAFQPGSAATTQIDQIVCQLWQVDATPAYDIMVNRSLARSFWSWLAQSATEFGYEVSDGVPTSSR